jgi:hypothetical protein
LKTGLDGTSTTLPVIRRTAGRHRRAVDLAIGDPREQPLGLRAVACRISHGDRSARGSAGTQGLDPILEIFAGSSLAP